MSSRKSAAVHTIRVVSERTAIPLDTLRVWERRYGFPAPARRENSNRRLYTQDDVEKLIELARVLELGYRPGDVVHLTLADLRALSAESEAAHITPGASVSASPYQVDDLLAFLQRDELRNVERALRLAAATLGPRGFLIQLAQPLLVAVGQAWAAGKLEIRQEHALTQVLTTQLRSLLSPLQELESGPLVLLATLPAEPHSLGLEMVALYLAIVGARPRLIGPDTPPEELARATQALGADAVGLTLTNAVPAVTARQDLDRLCAALPRQTPVWLGGAAAAEFVSRDSRLRLVDDWARLDSALAEVRLRVPRPRARTGS